MKWKGSSETQVSTKTSFRYWHSWIPTTHPRRIRNFLYIQRNKNTDGTSQDEYGPDLAVECEKVASTTQSDMAIGGGKSGMDDVQHEALEPVFKIAEIKKNGIESESPPPPNGHV